MFDYEKSFTRTDEYGQTSVEYYPPRYVNTIGTAKPTINGAWVGYGEVSSKESSGKCSVETTAGEILNSGSVANNNVSCKTHVYNAGNYYNFPSVVSDGNIANSICPNGWRLPESNNNTSYSDFLLTYNIDFNAENKLIQPFDSALLNLPLSFLRSGIYYDLGSLNGRGSRGDYWSAVGSSSAGAHRLYFNSGDLRPQVSSSKYLGFAVRCVSR